MKQNEVNIGIFEEDRKKIAAGLATLLSDTYLLYLKTQNFHWNVTGPNFSELHLLFEKQYKDLAEAADEIAESIRSLGFPAPGTFNEFQKRSSISEAPGGLHAKEMIKDLIDGQTKVLMCARSVFENADKARDIGTADLVTQRMRVHEKNAWMLRSLLEG